MTQLAELTGLLIDASSESLQLVPPLSSEKVFGEKMFGEKEELPAQSNLSAHCNLEDWSKDYNPSAKAISKSMVSEALSRGRLER